MNIALITAKGGNKSIPNKNLLKINGKSLLGHIIEIAKSAKKIDGIYVSTEDALIKDECGKYDIKVIERPAELAKPDANHGDAILHAFDEVQKLHGKIETLTILLGNSVLVRGIDIDNCIELLEENPDATGTMTVWEAQDDHPMRAMRINGHGYLESYLSNGVKNTNRQSYTQVLYYDQGPWTVRAETLENARKKQDGPACWWWMGARVLPIIRKWVTGRDVHSLLDLAVHEAWLNGKMWELK